MARFFRSGLLRGVCISLILLDFWAGLAFAQDLPGAEKAAQAKNYDRVIELLSPYVEKLSRENLHLLADAYSQKGNSMSAIKMYETALSLNPKDATSKTRIGLEYVKMGKQKEALVAFREAIELNPKYEPAYLEMARILEKREEIKKNEKDKNRYDIRLLFEDLIKAVGHKPDYITKLCELSTWDGQYDLSPKYCQEGIKLAPNEPRNYVHYAMTLHETGKAKEADEMFMKAADKFPKSELAQLAMADHFAGQKNFAKAYIYYKRATDANADSLKAMYGVAKAGLEIQKYEEAFQALKKACRGNRSASAEVRSGMASLKAQKNSEWLSKFDTLLDTCGLNP